MLEESTGMIGPVVEVSSGAQEADCGDIRIIGADTHRNRSASVRSEQDHSVRITHLLEMINGVAQIINPALQREVTSAIATPTEVERHRGAPELTGNPIDQLRECAARQLRVERANRKAVAEDDAGAGLRIIRRMGDMACEREALRLNRSFIPGMVQPGCSAARCAFDGFGAWGGEAIAAVACLGQRVGREAQCDTEVDELVERRIVVLALQVVDQLRALVAEESAVLELRVILHQERIYRTRAQPPRPHRPAPKRVDARAPGGTRASNTTVWDCTTS